MLGYPCIILWFGMTIQEVWTADNTLTEGNDTVVPPVRPSALMTLRRWFQRQVMPHRPYPATPRSQTSETTTTHTHRPLGYTRDPVCNMSAFVRQARQCWKAAALYSDKPDGICAHKVDSLFRRCLVRVLRVTSCEDDERAKQRIRGEVDSQRAQCLGGPVRRTANGSPGCPAPFMACVLLAAVLFLLLPPPPLNPLKSY